MTKKLILALTAVLALAACNKEQASSDEHVNELIKKYIKAHPEEIIASVKNVKGFGQAAGQQGQQRQEADPAAVKKVVDQILASKNHLVVGNKASKNTVIEFYDYNCGYCKRALDTVLKLAGDSKVVLVELPILGPTSVTAAKASLAISRIAPAKAFEFHQELLKAPGHLDDAAVAAAAAKFGIDKAKYDAEVAKPEYAKILEENTNLARSIGIGGTPSFIVNGKVVRGAQPYEVFKAELKN